MKKILSINWKTNIIPNLDIGDFGNNMKTIYEYDAVLLNLNSISYNAYWDLLYKKGIRREFSTFFENGGLCFVFMPLTSALGDVFTWFPESDNLVASRYNGLQLYNIDIEFAFLFKHAGYQLNYYFTKYPENSIILATNKPGNPVSLYIPIQEGGCIILPSLKQLDKIYSIIYNNLNSFYPELEFGIKPEWVSSYLSEKETELFNKKEEIEEKLGKYSVYKELLWGTGTKLEKLVRQSLAELGCNVTRLPIDSACDFEVDLGDGLIGVCEIKGLKKNATKDEMRQLLEYFIDQRDFKEKQVKGIMILNHYRDTHPLKRPEPLSEGGKKLAIDYKFKIMTTIELYNYLNLYWNKKLTTEEFIKNLKL